MSVVSTKQRLETLKSWIQYMKRGSKEVKRKKYGKKRR
jgi:hypothetical protein